MSSYQFVNSLAQCYAQQGRAGDQSHQAASPGGDYYNPNAAAASNYPPACYSPPQVGPQGYTPHPYAAPAPGHGLQPMGDYTQLQPQRIPGPAGSSHMHHASPGGQSPGMLNPSASCKYADSTSSTGVASPQDLSTNAPPSRATPPIANTQSSNNSNATITSNKSSGLTSPLSVSTSPGIKPNVASSTVSQNLSSPASSTSSTSSNDQKVNTNNNNSKTGSQSNPPQIYPWMKRVHLGQSGDNAEYFRNRKGYFSLNIQIVGDTDLYVRDIVARWPGSTHDQTVFNNSLLKARFENNEFGNLIMLGDSGYALRKYLITPIPNPTTEAEQVFNESQIRTRNPIERLFGVLKRRFPILSLGIRVSLETAKSVIIACAVLHNIAVNMNEPDPLNDPAVNVQNEANENNIDARDHREVNNFREEFIVYFMNLLEDHRN